jgi:hypothetical protein
VLTQDCIATKVFICIWVVTKIFFSVTWVATKKESHKPLDLKKLFFYIISFVCSVFCFEDRVQGVQWFERNKFWMCSWQVVNLQKIVPTHRDNENKQTVHTIHPTKLTEKSNFHQVN